MRHYDIPYVKNGPVNYFPVVPLNEMSLEDIKKKYIKMCAKANGDVSMCSKCKTPCPEGKRAIQLVANEIYNDPPIPLYGGKTLIERAKEENMKRREEEEKKADAEKEEKKTSEKKTSEKKEKKNYLKRGEWWEESLAAGDQIQWLVDNMGLSKTQAKKKIYQYKYSHKMLDSQAKDKEEFSAVPVVTTTMKNFEAAANAAAEPKIQGTKDSTIENKLETLMKLQEEHKKAMMEYQRLYEQAKSEYEKIKQKTDVLCNALDILNDI